MTDGKRRVIPNLQPRVSMLAPSVTPIGRPSGWERQRASAVGKLTSPYTHRRWRKRRADQLAREPLCCYCQRKGITRLATVADHIEPHRGDEQAFWQGALQSLCQWCHSAEKQREEQGSNPSGGPRGF